MLFMKGTPAEPKCGFSRQIVEILNNRNIDYATFDILEDNEVRQGMNYDMSLGVIEDTCFIYLSLLDATLAEPPEYLLWGNRSCPGQ